MRSFAALSMVLTVLLATPTFAQNDADRQFTFAYQLMRRGETELAVDAFESFNRQFDDDPRTSDAYYYLALLSYRQGDVDTARRSLSQVSRPVTIAPAAVDLLRGQVLLVSNQPAESAKVLEQIEESKLADDATRSTWRYLLGVAYRSIGNDAGAAAQFEASAKLETSIQAAALLELGKARIALNQTNQAIDALRRAAKAAGDPAVAGDARALAAGLAYQAGRFDLAAELWREVIDQHATHPAFQQAPLQRVQALAAGGQYPRLIEEYDALAKLMSESDRAEATYWLAVSQAQLEKYHAAAETLESFLKNYGDHPMAAEAHYLLAVSLYRTEQFERFEQVAADFVADRRNSPRRMDLMYLWGQAAIRTDRAEEAIRRLSPLAESQGEPHAATALLQRAALFARTDRADRAIADYQAFVERYEADPRVATARRRLIDLAFRQGEFEKVIPAAKQWLADGRPDTAAAANVKLRLAIAQIKSDATEAALKTLDDLIATKPADDVASLAHYYRGLLLTARAPVAAGADNATLHQAVASLEQALAGPLGESQKLESWQLLARLQRTAGRTDKALDAFEQLSRRKKPAEFETPVAMWIGRELLRRGDADKAIRWFTLVLERSGLEPDTETEALFRAGQAYRELGQWSKAIDALRKVVAFGHGFGDQGRLGLAQALVGAEQVDQALDEYDMLMSADSSRVAATALFEGAHLRMKRANQYAAAKDERRASAERREARKRLNRLVILYSLPQLEPLPQQALLDLARLDMAAGAPDAAREHYRELIQRFGESPWAAIARAEVMILDGKRGDGVFLLEKVATKSESDVVKQAARRRLRELGETP